MNLLPAKPIHLVAMTKGPERYVVIYRDDQRPEALRTLGRWASTYGLNFDWHDAAVMCAKVRGTSRNREET
jgi:hypothetical protein